MNASHALEGGMYSIGAVERSTGLTKDTLRVWERRYGFPKPQRDELGERLYQGADVDKLRVIKRLIDRGYRPGKIVGLPVNDLKRLADSLGEVDTPAELVPLIEIVKSHRAGELEGVLSQVLARSGLQRFVLDTIAPLNYHIGVAWMRGQLEVFEEHIYTEVVQSLIRTAIRGIRGNEGRPRVLLTTLPGEQHSLGMLMVQALLSVEGALCISLGPQTPVEEIGMAAQRHDADIIALSFSAAFPASHLFESVTDLRGRLAQGRSLWIGGGHPAIPRCAVPGVTPLQHLHDINRALARWRGERAAAAPNTESSLALAEA
jgi:MerR family transcriptional regulator, light-induced transcriptional regulator